MPTLIISEKPSASEKIAEALADGKVEKINKNGSYYFKITRDKKEIFIVPAVGHLFGLALKSKKAVCPDFNVEWKPTWKIAKINEYAKKYYDNLEETAKKCDEFIVATDWDIEGDVIAKNILRFLCGKEDAKRMKFSTLTKQELNDAYDNALKNMDAGQVQAGLTRHYLDFYYGINISRILTSSIKKFGKVFSIVSIGRVQGPMLNFLAEREKEIKAFTPVPFWQILLNYNIQGGSFEAMYEKKQIWEEETADKVLSECKNKTGSIKEIKKTKKIKEPPAPFNLTTLQTEAYNLFSYSPKQTMDIAQSLYTSAYISYPRTSSQQLPSQLNLKSIIAKLSKQNIYKPLCEKLLSKSKVEPKEGKKSDPAHPAIHPTGETPKKLSAPESKLYDLITRRFLSCFAEPALRESMSIIIDINNNIFRSSGSRTLESNWIEFYGPFAKFQEKTFPDIKEKEKIQIESIQKLDKETAPPSRYSQGSILKELEERVIGTKATRAGILQTLYDRGYIRDKSIEVTEFGVNLIEVLSDSCKSIISEELTRDFEKQMEKINKGKESMEKTLEKAEGLVSEIVNEMKNNEEKIGTKLSKAVIEKRENESTFGTCPNCKTGILKIFYSPRTKKRFVGCTSYPNCKTGFPIPLKGKLQKTDKVCDKCKTPIIYVYRQGMRPFKMCLDPKCETKAEWGKKKAKAKAKTEEDKETERIIKEEILSSEKPKSKKPKAKKQVKTKKE